ncbi:MAG: rRNA pseudouridine synthase [Cyclobacteriaceae bacterium]|nr:rRNA pseudouridine synthase [Cyclobacteriaceae bacterium]MCH8515015.1 rRNA pseudouridine synthase [Cyclobacteriaceae bacterium]
MNRKKQEDGRRPSNGSAPRSRREDANSSRYSAEKSSKPYRSKSDRGSDSSTYRKDEGGAYDKRSNFSSSKPNRYSKDYEGESGAKRYQGSRGESSSHAKKRTFKSDKDRDFRQERPFSGKSRKDGAYNPDSKKYRGEESNEGFDRKKRPEYRQTGFQNRNKPGDDFQSKNYREGGRSYPKRRVNAHPDTFVSGRQAEEGYEPPKRKVFDKSDRSDRPYQDRKVRTDRPYQERQERQERSDRPYQARQERPERVFRDKSGRDDRRAPRGKKYDDAKVDNRVPGTLKYAPQIEGDEKITKDTPIRLNRYISMSGLCSRRDADLMITEGEVKVNGKITTELGLKVTRRDRVSVKGKPLSPERKVYILMNKPKDYITTKSDTHGRRTVMDLLKNACEENVFPVGRLDRATTGLLIFTNDGALADKLMHPSHKVEKLYEVRLDKPILQEDLEKIDAGVVLEDGAAPVEEVAVVTPDRMSLGIKIVIGRNRIVRRIFESLGYRIEKLDRVMYAGLTKKEVPRGKWRFLSEKEVIRLKHFK